MIRYLIKFINTINFYFIQFINTINLYLINIKCFKKIESYRSKSSRKAYRTIF